MMKGAVLPTASCRSSNGGGKSAVHVIVPVLVSAGLLALLLVFWISKLAAVGILRDRITQPEELGGIGGHVGCLLATTPPHIRTAIPRGVAMALLHFATTSEVPQQSKEELSATLAVLLKRSPCNFLVYGMWHDSLLWATFNHGGRTVFLDESQDWIDRMKVKHPELETYKVDYTTTLKDAPELLSTARERRSGDCSPTQAIESSSCPLAMAQLPRELLSVQWDVIMIDGPRSFPKFPEFPGRMSPIFTSAAMARSRTTAGYTDVFLHDISRPLETEFGQEFLCRSNLVKSVGDLWHFQIHPSNSTEFCLQFDDQVEAL